MYYMVKYRRRNANFYEKIWYAYAVSVEAARCGLYPNSQHYVKMGDFNNESG